MGLPTQIVKEQARRAAATGPGVRIEYDGRTYTVHAGEIPATVALELRAQAGMSLLQLWEAISAETSYELVGLLVWLARRIGGERVSVEEVLSQITDATPIHIEGVDPTPAPADPVVSGADGEAVSPNA